MRQPALCLAGVLLLLAGPPEANVTIAFATVATTTIAGEVGEIVDGLAEEAQ